MKEKDLRKRYSGYRRRRTPKWLFYASITLLVLIGVMIACIPFFIIKSLSDKEPLNESSVTNLAITTEDASTYEHNPEIKLPDEYLQDESLLNEQQHTGYPMVQISDDDIATVAGAVSALAEDQPYECKVAIAQVIYNRMKYESKTMLEVINEPNQFDNVEQFYKGPDCDVCYAAAREALYNYPIPTTVLFFQKDSYHSWEGIHDWKQIGDYCFSWSQKAFDDYNAAGYHMTVEDMEP